MFGKVCKIWLDIKLSFGGIRRLIKKASELCFRYKSICYYLAAFATAKRTFDNTINKNWDNNCKTSRQPNASNNHNS